MRTFIGILGLIIGVLFGGVALISLGVSQGYLLLLVLGLVFTITSILALLSIITWRLWFSNRGWKLYTSETPTKPIPYSEKIEVWRSETPQVQGMYCKLDLGRERRFDFIQFSHDTPQVSSSETPIKWRMWFYHEDNGYALRYKRPFKPYIETGDPETCQDTVAIIVKLKKPILARFIEVKIVEPYKLHQWCIKAIRIRTVIFSLSIRYTIGKCILDRL